MKKHPRRKYFVAIHKENKASLRIAGKLGFHKKAVILEKLKSKSKRKLAK